jgi:predicted outer membrane repeat protein
LNDTSLTHGGSIYCLYCYNINLNGILFENNQALLFGGALYISETSSIIKITNSIFLRNKGLDGGAF